MVMLKLVSTDHSRCHISLTCLHVDTYDDKRFFNFVDMLYNWTRICRASATAHFGKSSA